jgi:hypothetical protein
MHVEEQLTVKVHSEEVEEEVAGEEGEGEELPAQLGTPV